MTLSKGGMATHKLNLGHLSPGIYYVKFGSRTVKFTIAE
jgi:hypothetical protein